MLYILCNKKSEESMQDTSLAISTAISNSRKVFIFINIYFRLYKIHFGTEDNH